MKLKLKYLTLSLLLSLTLAGCNTMEGLGKDIKKAGSSIEKSAHKGSEKAEDN